MDKKLLLRLAAWKAVVFAFIGLCLLGFPERFNADNYFANFRWPPEGGVTRRVMLKTWDAQHYLFLSRVGYRADSVSNNFYPLWPALIRLGSGRPLLSALILSNLFSLAAAALFHAYVRKRHGPKTADAASLLLIAFPGAMFLNLAYSESLFFLLCMALFYCLDEERWGAAAAAAFLLPLSRPQGLMVAAPLWWALYANRRKAPWFCWLSPAAGFTAYLFLMFLSTGNAFEGFAAAASLYRPTPTVMKIFDLPGFLGSLFNVTSFHDYGGSLLDRSWLVLLLASLPALWKKDKLYFIFAATLGLASAATMSFVSYTRYFLLLFPVFIFLGDSLSRGARRAALGGFAGLQAFLLFRHVNNDWAG